MVVSWPELSIGGDLSIWSIFQTEVAVIKESSALQHNESGFCEADQHLIS